jgi:hypothetical protein
MAEFVKAQEAAVNSIEKQSETFKLLAKALEIYIFPIARKKGYEITDRPASEPRSVLNPYLWIIKKPFRERKHYEIFINVYVGPSSPDDLRPRMELEGWDPIDLYMSIKKSNLDLKNPSESFEKFLDEYETLYKEKTRR